MALAQAACAAEGSGRAVPAARLARRAITAVLLAAPTTFSDDEYLDLANLGRAVVFLADAGADAICRLANYSEQFSLTDAERDRVAICVLDRAAGRCAGRGGHLLLLRRVFR